MLYNEGSLHNNIREKTKETLLYQHMFSLVLLLHVSAPILGHHQAYNNTSLSSSVACNFIMNPYCTPVGLKCLN
jgi:hypothetical protein